MEIDSYDKFVADLEESHDGEISDILLELNESEYLFYNLFQNNAVEIINRIAESYPDHIPLLLKEGFSSGNPELLNCSKEYLIQDLYFVYMVSPRQTLRSFQWLASHTPPDFNMKFKEDTIFSHTMRTVLYAHQLWLEDHSEGFYCEDAIPLLKWLIQQGCEWNDSQIEAMLERREEYEYETEKDTPYRVINQLKSSVL